MHARHFASWLFGKGDDDGKPNPDGEEGRDGRDGQDGLFHRASDEGEEGILPQNRAIPMLPRVIAMPVRRRPLFPGLMVPLLVRDAALIDALKKRQKDNLAYVGVFLRRDADAVEAPPEDLQSEDGSEMQNENSQFMAQLHSAMESGHDVNSFDGIYHTGTLAQVVRMLEVPGTGAMQVLLMGHRRIMATEPLSSEPLFEVKIKHRPDGAMNSDDRETARAYASEIFNTIKDLLRLNPVYKEQLAMFISTADIANPALLADYAASLTGANPKDLQRVLEAFEPIERLEKALTLLRSELEVAKLQQRIQEEVNAKVTEHQRKYMLKEQLKLIQRELGMEKDERETVAAMVKERLEEREVPEDAQRVIDEELDKLSTMERSSAEFTLTRNYLDWLSVLPWGMYSQDQFDLDKSREILDRDHFGLTEVKDRIQEFLAVAKLLGGVTHGKIICLVGPPGVGKTSIGKSIADALNRKFLRFSVGGMTDVAEIKGHRRTYIGAMPGKLVQGLKKVGTSNPVVLIDEIDKIGQAGHRGDPSSALLEVLDPEQNSSFGDHYLDTPIDLSKVLFLCTANVEHTIPGPLADRMEFVRLSGYVSQEKEAIARQYLEPKARESCGVPEDRVTVDDSAFQSLIRWYCREAGVRNLQKHIEKLYRKVAYRLVRKPDLEHVTIDEGNLADYVGKRVYSKDRLYDEPPPGVVMGLAWNERGGTALYIESAKLPATSTATGGVMKVTGQLGDVMKESAEIALTVARAQLDKRNQGTTFFRDAAVHVHVPEGATPKDGPSAGITMTTSLLSLSTGRRVKPNLAMTGEVTVTGRVLPIGGVREKTVAAKRANINELIFPADNRGDFEELPDYIREGVTAHFVETYDEVYDLAFV